jgi:cobalt/nickel transport system permease protein
MHMADSLLSPAVGTVMWGATAGLIAYSSKKVQSDMDDGKAPLMGVLGAFVFAAQMINFSIPGTGSSGHLGGALLLSILLGKHAAFLTISSILAIQALFFADGGLLAMGANIFNLGFFPCFIAYPLIYKPIAASDPGKGKLLAGICLAAVLGLQLGAFGVVLETQLSGIAEIPFMPFLLLMQPVHLAIGLVEGLVTAAAVLFVLEARPDMRLTVAGTQQPTLHPRGLLAGFLLVALLTGGALSWFASSDPDGLEWSVAKASGQEELEDREGLHAMLAGLQRKIAFLPDYNLPESQPASDKEAAADKPAAWPAVDGGQSTAGVIGVLITLLAAGAIGNLLKLAARRTVK